MQLLVLEIHIVPSEKIAGDVFREKEYRVQRVILVVLSAGEFRAFPPSPALYTLHVVTPADSILGVRRHSEGRMPGTRLRLWLCAVVGVVTVWLPLGTGEASRVP